MTYKVTTSSGQEYTTESKSGDSALWEAKRLYPWIEWASVEAVDNSDLTDKVK